MTSYSVVVCTYNGERYIVEQLKSILEQTHPISEIILCDDGSTDKTLEVAESLFVASGFKNYRILAGRVNRGVVANFLRGLKTSTGDYVFTCDQDDVWCRDKVEVFAKAAERSHKQLYFSDGYVVDADLSKRPYSLWDSLHFSPSALNNKSMLDVLLSRCVVTGAAMMVSRSLIDEIDSVPSCWLHDGWFAMVAACSDSIQPIDRKTFLYRQHGSNVVGAHSDSFRGRVKNWVDNISDQPRIRKERFERYQWAQTLVGSDNASLNQCLEFWGTLRDMKNSSKLKNLGAVIKEFSSGSYSSFYTGARGALRDVISILVPSRANRDD